MNKFCSLLVLNKSVKISKMKYFVLPESDSAVVQLPASTVPVHSSFNFVYQRN